MIKRLFALMCVFAVFAVSCGSAPPPSPPVIEEPPAKPDPNDAAKEALLAGLRLGLDAARKNALEQKAAADEHGAKKTAAESYLDAENVFADAEQIDARLTGQSNSGANAEEDFTAAINRYDEAAGAYALAAQRAKDRRAEAEAALLAAQQRVAASDEAAQKAEAELLGADG
jgi:hypothetical protein